MSGPVWYTAVALLSEARGDHDDNDQQSSVRDEVTYWFFDDYLPTWIGVGAGTIARGPEFILDYWAAPLHWSDEQGSRWFLDAPAVVARPGARCKPGFAQRAMATPPCPTTRSAFITTTARRSR